MDPKIKRDNLARKNSKSLDNYERTEQGTKQGPEQRIEKGREQDTE